VLYSSMALLIKLVAAIASRWGWLNLTITRFVVNRLVKSGRTRPHPWSTISDYTSWTSLTNRQYYARLLPADRTFPEVEALGTRRPPVEEVVKLFATTGDTQRLDPQSTCLFPAFAQYLTDGFLRTRLDNDDTKSRREQTTSNHDIDMSPLYGRTPEQTHALRLNLNSIGRKGRLKSQLIDREECSPWLFDREGQHIQHDFVDLDVPLGLDHASPNARRTLFATGGDRVNSSPQTAMINTLFLREHNRLAGRLETAHPEWDDERVFQTARNSIIVMFIKVVIEEYINHISTIKFPLRMLPNVAYNASWNRPNWMTAEFALLYRWHSLVPQQMMWGDTAYDGTVTLLNNSLLIERGLAQSFIDVSANQATELGLGNSASFVLSAEGKAIKQARLVHLGTYASYRRAMGKSVPATFAELVGTSNTSDEQARRLALAERLTELYGTVENLEFYVGLFAEPREANGPLPTLITSMVAMDAFSQALTNPLLSEHVWGDITNRRATFTDVGLEAIADTSTLRDVLTRNATLARRQFVGMTHHW
jgi:prostaglandin-endoperoxide synthase 2